MDATTGNAGGEIHCLRGRRKKPASLTTVDGFPIQDNFNFLPNTPDPTINQWSYGTTTKVEVWYDDYWQNLKHGKYRKKVVWKGHTIVVEDYQWFLDDIWDRMHGYPKSWEGKPGLYHRPPKTKEQALDDWLELELYIQNHPN